MSTHTQSTSIGCRSSTPTILYVRVSKKTHAHPFYGQGSSFGYQINDIEGLTLCLVRGTTYQFEINNHGHPFFLTTNPTGGSKTTDTFSDAVDVGTLVITPDSTFPKHLYYQCAIHEKMGGHVIIISPKVSPVSPVSIVHHSIDLEPTSWHLRSPIALTYAPKDPQTIYIAEQSGFVYRTRLDIVGENNPPMSLFLDVHENLPKLNPMYDERGLLDLCFDPNFTTQNGQFYIFYSTNLNKYPQRGEKKALYYNCISAFTVQNGKVLYDQEIVLVKIPKNLTYHNGGKMLIGPDGYLYITIGDGGPQGDPDMKAQDPTQIYGKIIRINVNKLRYNSTNIKSKQGSSPSHISSGIEKSRISEEKDTSSSPFHTVGYASPEIYAYGFRNPWGLSLWKRQLIVTDAGSDQGIGKERIYVVKKNGNYGWPIIEGTIDRFPNQITAKMIRPIFEYTTGQAGFAKSPQFSAIVGGYTIGNDYVFADVSGMIHRFNLSSKQYLEGTQLRGSQQFIKSFGQDALGHLYVLISDSLGVNGHGMIMRVRLT